MPCPQTPRPGRLLNSSTRTRSFSSTIRNDRGSVAAASWAIASSATPQAASKATAWRRLNAIAALHCAGSMAAPSWLDSHLPEQVGVRLADGQRFRPVLQAQVEVAAAVADHAVDRVDVDDDRPVHLPEHDRVQLRRELADGL